jgi:hypothetical protein
MDSIAFEMLVWRLSIYAAGALPSISTALYFAIVACTTLGYGDVLLPLDWRLMSGLLSTTGLPMFAWSTAILATYFQPTLSKPARHIRRLTPPALTWSRDACSKSHRCCMTPARAGTAHWPPIEMVHSWSKLT